MLTREAKGAAAVPLPVASEPVVATWMTVAADSSASGAPATPMADSARAVAASTCAASSASSFVQSSRLSASCRALVAEGTRSTPNS